MYVCVCKAVTESRIRRAAGEGVRHLRELRHSTGLGSACGKCVRQAYAVLTGALEQAPALGEAPRQRSA